LIFDTVATALYQLSIGPSVTTHADRSTPRAAAQDFPGASLPAYEVQAALGKLYMDGGEGLEANPTLAAEWFNEAAEAATEAMKAKLANKYFELAAVAEGMCDDDE
jgi:TPR repeat protein